MKQKVRKNSALRSAEYYGQQPILDELYAKSKRNERFSHLLELIISRENIMQAYRNIKRNKGAYTAGTDGKTIAFLASMPENKFVEYIRKRFANYHPKAVRRVDIPKPNGKLRPLGIPCIADRVIQQCILQIMEPICEAKFYEHSYGFRPNRSAENAVAYMTNRMFIGNLYYVVDVDIKGFFDHVNHRKLMQQLWALGIQDTKLLQIIKSMLKGPIQMPDGSTVHPTEGTPQGGILSPLLANIVLNELDWWIASQWELFSDHLKKPYKPQYNTRGVRDLAYVYRVMRTTNLKEMHIVRYADDFKIICAKRDDAERAMEAVKHWLWKRLKLEVSEEKSKVTNVKKHYSEFLGFKIKVRKKAGRWVNQSHVCDKAITHAKENIRKSIREIQRTGTEESQHQRISAYNALVIGLHNYYRIATCVSMDFRKIGYDTGSTRKIRLRGLKKTGTIGNKYISEHYGASQQMRWLNGEPVVPVSYVQYQVAHRKCKDINKYTPEGREKLHKNLAIDVSTMIWLMKHPALNESIEFNDNCVSLFAGQRGKCFITETALCPWNISGYRKVPKSMGGTDAYGNLILISKIAKQLLTDRDCNDVKAMATTMQLNTKQMKKVNLLRTAAGLGEFSL